ncbi:hypothetical protein RIF29_16060 [Crotalaria pallida]|uniref:Uncharacterized protein n=1 Tax=Crotalaria pallida TaxID=3830 RepID=A0AAN9ID66_CROPI
MNAKSISWSCSLRWVALLSNSLNSSPIISGIIVVIKKKKSGIIVFVPKIPLLQTSVYWHIHYLSPQIKTPLKISSNKFRLLSG